MITSGGNRNPAKLDCGACTGGRRGISPAFLSRPSVNATKPLAGLDLDDARPIRDEIERRVRRMLAELEP